MTSKCIPGKKSVAGDDGLPVDGAYPGLGCTSGADLYNPDQPLWKSSGLESSNARLSLQSSKIDETELISSEALNSDFPVGSTRTSVNLQGASPSIWGRIGSSRNRFDMKEKTNS